MFDRDIIVIGGGTAGYAAAIHASKMGARVALVEKDALGGTCLNRGCVPTKALFRSVELLRRIRQAGALGIDVDNARVNFGNILSHKDRVVMRMVQGVERLVKANRIELLRTTGSIVSPHEVQAGTQRISAGKIVIATGSVPVRPGIPGIDLPGVYTTDDILRMAEIPESLVIIGGGYIGTEFAGIFSALGVRVTVVELLPRCLDFLDDDMAEVITGRLESEDVEIKTGARAMSIVRKGKGLQVELKTGDGEDRATGKVVLVATGRAPYSAGLGLEGTGVNTGKGVKVNAHLETGEPGVYAVGDVLGGHMLAHVAYYEAGIAVRNALGDPCRVDYAAVPKCIFTDPEMASVGLTEKQAGKRRGGCAVSKFPYAASGAAATMNETVGKVKMVCEPKTGAILGVHIVGAHASELIAEVTLAMRMGATARDIANTMHAHPTLSEIVREAAMAQAGGSLHLVEI